MGRRDGLIPKGNRDEVGDRWGKDKRQTQTTLDPAHVCQGKENLKVKFNSY